MATIKSRALKSKGTVRHSVYFRHDRRQTSETFDTMKEAVEFKGWVEEFGAAEAVAILTGQQGAGERNMSLGEWCLVYIDQLTGVQEGTRQKYRGYVETNLEGLVQRPVNSISAPMIAAWVNGMEAEGLSGKTIALRHGFLSGAMKGAVRAKQATANPCDGTRLPRTEEDEMVFLNQAEFATLLAYVRPDYQDMVACMPGTVMRWGELTASQPRDLDLQQGTLSIVRAWKWSEGSTPKLGPPKTKRSRRTIGLPEQIVEIYERRIHGLAPDDFIFTRPDGRPWTSPAFHSAVWQPAVRNARGELYRRHAPKGDQPARLRKDGQPWGKRPSLQRVAPEGQQLTKKPRIHDMRHTGASWMIAAGVPLPVIQRHLGHESIQTTVDRYGHLEPAHLQAAGAALGAALTLALPQIEA